MSARPPTELYLVRGRTYDVHVSILSGTQHVRTRGVEMNLILELSPAGSASPGSALSARESARRVESGAACDGDGRSPHACFEQTPTALGPRSLVVELPLPDVNASESESGLRPGAAAEVRCGPRGQTDDKLPFTLHYISFESATHHFNHNWTSGLALPYTHFDLRRCGRRRRRTSCGGGSFA